MRSEPLHMNALVAARPGRADVLELKNRTHVGVGHHLAGLVPFTPLGSSDKNKT